jgi:AraC-like DNA-binding protein
MHLNGDCISGIAEKTGISRTTQWRTRNSRDSDGFETLEKRTNGCGLKPAIGFHTDRKILKAVKENHFLTAVTIFRDKIINRQNISESTFERYLNTVGLKTRRKRKRVKMTPKHDKASIFFFKNVQKLKMKQ